MSTQTHPYRQYIQQRVIDGFTPFRRRSIQAIERYHLFAIATVAGVVLTLVVAHTVIDIFGNPIWFVVVMSIWLVSMTVMMWAGFVKDPYDRYVSSVLNDVSESGYLNYRDFLAQTPVEQWPPTPQVAFANLATGDDTVAGYAGYGAISRWMMRQGHFVKMLIGSGVMLAAGILLALVFPGQINKLVLIVLTYGGLYGAMAIMIAGPNQTSLLQGAKKALNEHGKWQERYRHELTLPIQDPLIT